MTDEPRNRLDPQSEVDRILSQYGPQVPNPLYDSRSYLAYYLQQAGRTPSPQMAEALKQSPSSRAWMRDYLSPEVADFLAKALQYGPLALPAGSRAGATRGNDYVWANSVERAMQRRLEADPLARGRVGRNYEPTWDYGITGGRTEPMHRNHSSEGLLNGNPRFNINRLTAYDLQMMRQGWNPANIFLGEPPPPPTATAPPTPPPSRPSLSVIQGGKKD